MGNLESSYLIAKDSIFSSESLKQELSLELFCLLTIASWVFKPKISETLFSSFMFSEEAVNRVAIWALIDSIVLRQ